jgi:hypothetical protein
MIVTMLERVSGASLLVMACLVGWVLGGMAAWIIERWRRIEVRRRGVLASTRRELIEDQVEGLHLLLSSDLGRLHWRFLWRHLVSLEWRSVQSSNGKFIQLESPLGVIKLEIPAGFSEWLRKGPRGSECALVFPKLLEALNAQQGTLIEARLEALASGSNN